MRINDIKRARHRAHHHPHNLQTVEEHRPRPVVLQQIRRHDPEPVQARTPQHELRDHQNDAEFRLVDPPIAARHEFCAPVRQGARDQEADQGADEGARVGVPALDFAPEVGGAEEDGGDEDADEDGPADQRALDEAGPKNGWVEEEGEGTEEDLEDVLVRVGAVEGLEGLDEGAFGGVGAGVAVRWYGCLC